MNPDRPANRIPCALPTGTFEILWYAHITFDIIPLQYVPKLLLSKYIETSGIRVNVSIERAALIILVEKAFNKSIIHFKLYPSPTEFAGYIVTDRF